MKIVIFHIYVSLPEGKLLYTNVGKKHTERIRRTPQNIWIKQPNGGVHDDPWNSTAEKLHLRSPSLFQLKSSGLN